MHRWLDRGTHPSPRITCAVTGNRIPADRTHIYRRVVSPCAAEQEAVIRACRRCAVQCPVLWVRALGEGAVA